VNGQAAGTSAATVVAAHGRRGELLDECNRRLSYLVRGRSLRVVCGDRVRFVPGEESGTALVTAVDRRSNALIRASGPGRRADLLAANLSLIAVVIAVEPAPDWFIVDRFLCAAECMQAAGVLVANKCDIAEPDPEVLANYRRLGFPIVATSSSDGSGLDILARVFAGQSGVLVGQSGVGKTSLINALVPDADALTGQLVNKTGEGRHTTSASLMYALPGGGWLIDTPGVRDFVPKLDSVASVATGFREIHQFGRECRFSNCRHLREPGCAVKAAVRDGQIAERRYASYKRLINSLPDTDSG
jgi:ribosome biogenesis GTPase